MTKNELYGIDVVFGVHRNINAFAVVPDTQCICVGVDGNVDTGDGAERGLGLAYTQFGFFALVGFALVALAAFVRFCQLSILTINPHLLVPRIDKQFIYNLVQPTIV